MADPSKAGRGRASEQTAAFKRTHLEAQSVLIAAGAFGGAYEQAFLRLAIRAPGGPDVEVVIPARQVRLAELGRRSAALLVVAGLSPYDWVDLVDLHREAASAAAILLRVLDDVATSHPELLDEWEQRGLLDSETTLDQTALAELVSVWEDFFYACPARVQALATAYVGALAHNSTGVALTRDRNGERDIRPFEGFDRDLRPSRIA